MLWKFQTQVTQGQVTRSRQVTSTHKKFLNVPQRYTDWTIALKLSAIATSRSIYKLYISEFRYRWPNFDIGDLSVRSILWPLHYKSIGKNERRLFWTKTMKNTLKHRIRGGLDTLSRNIATDDPSSCHQGHFRSWKLTNSFSGITFGRDQLERWKHHRYI